MLVMLTRLVTDCTHLVCNVVTGLFAPSMLGRAHGTNFSRRRFAVKHQKCFEELDKEVITFSGVATSRKPTLVYFLVVVKNMLLIEKIKSIKEETHKIRISREYCCSTPPSGAAIIGVGVSVLTGEQVIGNTSQQNLYHVACLQPEQQKLNPT